MKSPTGVILEETRPCQTNVGLHSSSLIKITHFKCTPGTRRAGDGRRGQIIPYFLFFYFILLFSKHYKRPAISSGVYTHLALLLPVIILLCPLNSVLDERKITDNVRFCKITGHHTPPLSFPFLSHLLSIPLLSLDLQLRHQTSASVENVTLYVTISAKCISCAYTVRICILQTSQCWTINDCVSLDHILCRDLHSRRARVSALLLRC